MEPSLALAKQATGVLTICGVTASHLDYLSNAVAVESARKDIKNCSDLKSFRNHSLNHADANSEFCRYLSHSFAVGTCHLDLRLHFGGGTRPTEPSPPCYSPRETGAHSLLNHRPFELGKYSAHLKHRLSRGGSCIDPL